MLFGEKGMMADMEWCLHKKKKKKKEENIELAIDEQKRSPKLSQA